MIYRIKNVYIDTAKEVLNELGDRVVVRLTFTDADCVDLYIDPAITILKINDGNLTIDRGGVLYTIPYEDYSSIEIM